MMEDDYRLNDNLLVERNDEGFLLKFREEVGRGKRFGMDGTVPIDETAAEDLAKWVIVQQFGEALEG